MFWERYEEMGVKVSIKVQTPQFTIYMSQRVILDCNYITFVDSSGLSEIEVTCSKLIKSGVEVHLVNVPAFLAETLQQAGIEEEIGTSKIHTDLPEALVVGVPDETTHYSL